MKPAANFSWGEYQQVQFVPNSDGQRRYHRQLSYADIIVAYGPAGTGKTLFAVQEGLQRLRKGSVARVLSSAARTVLSKRRRGESRTCPLGHPRPPGPHWSR